MGGKTWIANINAMSELVSIMLRPDLTFDGVSEMLSGRYFIVGRL